MIERSTPTAVWPSIPLADMTLLERSLLSLVFDAKDEGGSLSFYTRHGPSEVITLPRVDLAEMLEDSVDGSGSTANQHVAERLDAAPVGEEADPLDDFNLEITGATWELILQDIVRRSSTIDEVVVKSTTVPDGPLFDELAASVTVITTSSIKSKSIAAALEDLKEDKLAISEGAIDAAMSLWGVALDFRNDANELKPLQRSIHRMLDAWDKLGSKRMRSWIIAIADDAVFAAEMLQTQHDARHWSFETEIAPSVLEAFDWHSDGPQICGGDADFLDNVLDGVRRRWPEGTEVF